MAQRGPRRKSSKERRKDIEFNAIVEEMAFVMSVADLNYLARRRAITYRMELALDRFYDWAETYQ